jgi:hypothetical protein
VPAKAGAVGASANPVPLGGGKRENAIDQGGFPEACIAPPPRILRGSVSAAAASGVVVTSAPPVPPAPPSSIRGENTTYHVKRTLAVQSAALSHAACAPITAVPCAVSSFTAISTSTTLAAITTCGAISYELAILERDVSQAVDGTARARRARCGIVTVAAVRFIPIGPGSTGLSVGASGHIREHDAVAEDEDASRVDVDSPSKRVGPTCKAEIQQRQACAWQYFEEARSLVSIKGNLVVLSVDNGFSSYDQGI